jgi:hypothetical protein
MRNLKIYEEFAQEEEILKKRSQYELNNRHEINVISILGLKPDF